MKPKDIQSFDDLKTYLATFTTWDGDHIHDFGGAFVLLGALLDNIRENTLDADLDSIHDYLTDEQRAFLLHLAVLADHRDEDDDR
jgi:hypothetical protein